MAGIVLVSESVTCVSSPHQYRDYECDPKQLIIDVAKLWRTYVASELDWVSLRH